MSLEDANTFMDQMVENIAQAIKAMADHNIGYDEAVSMLIGSFMAAAERVNSCEVAANHALCLVRLVEWRDHIRELADENDMLKACMANIDEIRDL